MSELMVNSLPDLEKDKEFLVKIKSNISHTDRSKASMMFNYYYYLSIYEFTKNSTEYKNALYALAFFTLKEDNLLNQIPAINNTYQIAIMINHEELLSVLIGKNSNIVSIKTDAAKMGLLLAYVYKKFNIPKTDILSETLFLTQSML